MAKGDPKKPKGKMSAYAFFVQTCREEHKKKNPEVPVNFAEFSKKCSERWKTMSGKEKSKLDEMAQADKVRYDQEMKDYGPAKGGKKKKDTNAPKRPPSGFFLFCSEFHPTIKSTNPGISIGDVAKKLGEMRNNLSGSEKQPYINKDVADYKSKGKFDATVDLSPCEYLRVGSALIDTPLTQECLLPSLCLITQLDHDHSVVSPSALAIVRGLH
uniref:HMG box domain-containing protein n=1 Tax=Moschus moschiferus TaxID=68415 RepID=A0A8C6FK81_MOSMO